MTFARRMVCTLLLVCVGVVPGRTTILAPMDLAELAAGARTIVYGRVVDTHAALIDGRTETAVTLGVPAYLKGEGGREIRFSVPGGQIGRYRTVVVGAPVLRPGDEVVVFLRGDHSERLSVVGFSQGVLRVVRASAGATPMVLSPPFDRDGRARRVARGEATKRFVPLATLVEDVRLLTVGAADRDAHKPGSATTGGR